MSLVVPVVYAAGPKKTGGSTTVQGVLSQDGPDYVIKSGKATYKVVGEGLAPLVGKKVIASGTVTKGEKGKVLEVKKIDEDLSKKK
jgi:hypothetical protein